MKDEVLTRRRVAAALLFATVAIGSAAQSYPAKPIRLVLPVAPGGGSDIIVRGVTQKAAAALGQQFVIDYRGGANGRTRAVNRVPACGM